MTIPIKTKIPEKILGDYYWAYSDILRDIGINESTYDQRIMAFMALKLLIDNDKLKFNFEYKNKFGLTTKLYNQYKKEDTKNTLLNLIQNIEQLGQNLNYFVQNAKYNPDTSTNILTYLNHFKTFELERYIQELPNNYLEDVLDIYTYKANFRDYPKEQYKDLYETTVQE
jgi:type I restriction enzyme M protein